MKLATLGGPLEIGVEYVRSLQLSRLDQLTPPFFDPGYPHNVGDWYLTKIVDRLLEYDELLIVYGDGTPEVWEEINSTCDAVVLRGGNIISPDFFSRHIGREKIERISIPIILFGAGVQDVPPDGVPFTEDEIAVLRHIHERCASSAVRGERTAEVLASIGITNTVITGCPTFYWSRKPQLELRKPLGHRAGFTFRQWLYTNDAGPYRSMFDALAQVRDQFDEVVVLVQGEEVALQDLYQNRSWGADRRVTISRDPGTLRLKRAPVDELALVESVHTRYGGWATPGELDWLIGHSFFSWDIADYLDLSRELDVVVGCRLHGNLLALANGTPAYFLTYDDRTREIVDFLAAPSSPVSALDASTRFSEQDWAPVQQRYTIGLGRLREFLEGNRLAHRLDA